MALLFANNNSLSEITTLPSSITGGAMTLISEQTASSSATIDFTSGIDSTYDSYVFKFYDIHPETDNVDFMFNGSTDSGSNYNVTKTTTIFRAIHDELDSTTSLSYSSTKDVAQSTSDTPITFQYGNGADESFAGSLQIFNPSSTTFVKHFIARTSAYTFNDYERDAYMAGYFNNINAINAIRFLNSSGNIDSGVIKLYGIS